VSSRSTSKAFTRKSQSQLRLQTLAKQSTTTTPKPHLNPSPMPSLEEETNMVPPATTSALRYELLAKCSVRMRSPKQTSNPCAKAPPIANESFLHSQTTRARAATLHLPHGPVPLPIFMPVATQASLKGLTPKQLEETGCRLCLNNTYHLYADLEAGREYGYTSLDAVD
jgi:hypothetical protein